MLTFVVESHAPYTWDHWPREEGRSNCGFVGLTNLGATCYMATCMQHLFMIPQARKSVLEARVRFAVIFSVVKEATSKIARQILI